jgi:hypothetical protein
VILNGWKSNITFVFCSNGGGGGAMTDVYEDIGKHHAPEQIAPDRQSLLNIPIQRKYHKDEEERQAFYGSLSLQL